MCLAFTRHLVLLWISNKRGVARITQECLTNLILFMLFCKIHCLVSIYQIPSLIFPCTKQAMNKDPLLLEPSLYGSSIICQGVILSYTATNCLNLECSTYLTVPQSYSGIQMHHSYGHLHTSTQYDLPILGLPTEALPLKLWPTVLCIYRQWSICFPYFESCNYPIQPPNVTLPQCNIFDSDQQHPKQSHMSALQPGTIDPIGLKTVSCLNPMVSTQSQLHHCTVLYSMGPVHQLHCMYLLTLPCTMDHHQ